MHKATRRHRIKLQRFVGEYLIDLNGTAAVKRMGFKGRRPDIAASKLMKHAQFAQMLDDAIEGRAKRVDADADYVLNLIIEQAERHRGRNVEGGAQVVMKAAHMLGAHLGMWKEKHQHEISGPNGGPVETKTTDPIAAANAYRELMQGIVPK
jgi:phage terminase small subunit